MQQQSNETISFIVQGQQFKIRKDLFQSCSQLKQQKKNFKKTTMPQWVTVKIFSKIEKYIVSKDLSSVNMNSIQQIQKILWIGDLFSLQNLQQKIINQLIIPGLNQNNSIVFLLESHKKLKNSDVSAQCWYSLLNNCMTYIATNIFKMYFKDPKQIKKLNQKILTQILQRSIKQLKKKNYQKKHEMYQIIIQSKQINDVSKLCTILKQAISKRKINPQIHANLAWKLTNIKQIQLKKTKIFKFIDYQWRLNASAIIQNNQRKLKISLILQNKFPMSESNLTTGTNNQEFQIKTQSAVTQFLTIPGSQFPKMNTFQRIGIFYLKLITKIGESVYQSDVRINYLNVQDHSSIDLLDFNSAQLDQVGSKKVELTLFCSIEPVYTFLLNYVLENHDFSKPSKQSFSLEEYNIMIKVLQKQGKYIQSFYIIWELVRNKKYTQTGIRTLIYNNDIRQISKQQLRKFCNNLKQIGYFKLREDLLNDLIPKQNNKKQQRFLDVRLQKQSSSYSQNKQSDKLIDSRRASRTRDSKSRLKKIFQSPRKNSIISDQRTLQKKRLQSDLDIRKYIYQRQSLFYKSFNDISSYF